MMAIETTHAVDDQNYDIKIPARLTEKDTGTKIVEALRKWAKRNAEE